MLRWPFYAVVYGICSLTDTKESGTTKQHEYKAVALSWLCRLFMKVRELSRRPLVSSGRFHVQMRAAGGCHCSAD